MSQPRPESSLKKANARPTEVRAFQLSGRFESLPEDIRRFRNLETLVLKGNALVSLPRWLEEFERLSSLVVINQGRGVLGGGVLESLARRGALRELEISMTPGLELPSAITQLDGLERLSLTFCELSTIPDPLGALERLTVLDLSNNKLSSIPESLGSLRLLRELLLADNQLEALPDGLFALERLELLKLSKNRFTVLPDRFAALSHLEKCALDSNRLTALPASFATQERLAILDIANNPLGTLPAAVRGLSRLRQLYAASCQLGQLPAFVGTLSELELLNVNTNLLTELPGWIGSMRRLEHLHFKANRIAVLPRELQSLQGLKTLMIGGNPLAPEVVARLVRNLPGCSVDYTDAGLNPKQRAAFEAAISAALALPAEEAPELPVPELRETLFGTASLADCKPGDDSLLPVEPWRSYQATKLAAERGATEEAVAELRRLITLPELSTRHTLQAWHLLRGLGSKPPPDESQRVLGVILEVHLEAGLDTLAAYADGSARYINHGGSLIVWEADDAEITVAIERLLAVAQQVAYRIGPWQGALPTPPPTRHLRLNMLTPSGLHFGEGPIDVLSADPLGGPLVAAGTALMLALTARVAPSPAAIT